MSEWLRPVIAPAQLILTLGMTCRSMKPDRLPAIVWITEARCINGPRSKLVMVTRMQAVGRGPELGVVFLEKRERLTEADEAGLALRQSLDGAYEAIAAGPVVVQARELVPSRQ